jgi:hypothetical protein
MLHDMPNGQPFVHLNVAAGEVCPPPSFLSCGVRYNTQHKKERVNKSRRVQVKPMNRCPLQWHQHSLTVLHGSRFSYVGVHAETVVCIMATFDHTECCTFSPWSQLPMLFSSVVSFDLDKYPRCPCPTNGASLDILSSVVVTRFCRNSWAYSNPPHVCLHGVMYHRQHPTEKRELKPPHKVHGAPLVMLSSVADITTCTLLREHSNLPLFGQHGTISNTPLKSW